MRTLKISAAATLLLVAFAATVAARPADHFSGTWEMNPARSKFSPGPAAKSITLTIETTARQMELTVESTGAMGKPFHAHYVAAFDGKYSPIEGMPGVRVKARRVNAYSIVTVEKGGKEMLTRRLTFERDGKTMRMVVTGTSAAGHRVHDIVFYEKE